MTTKPPEATTAVLDALIERREKEYRDRIRSKKRINDKQINAWAKNWKFALDKYEDAREFRAFEWYHELEYRKLLDGEGMMTPNYDDPQRIYNRKSYLVTRFASAPLFCREALQLPMEDSLRELVGDCREEIERFLYLGSGRGFPAESADLPDTSPTVSVYPESVNAHFNDRKAKLAFISKGLDGDFGEKVSKALKNPWAAVDVLMWKAGKTGWPIASVFVDLRMPDELLVREFAACIKWLKCEVPPNILYGNTEEALAALKKTKGARRKPVALRSYALGNDDFKNWCDYHVLPYLDLQTAAELDNVQLTDQALGDLLFAKDENDRKVIGKKERDTRDLIKSTKWHKNQLYAQYTKRQLAVQAIQERREAGK